MRNVTPRSSRRGALALVAAASLLACGTAETCVEPTGCARAERIAQTCSCVEWQVARTESIPVKFVVVSVDYGLVGTGSHVVYGNTPGSFHPASSELGVRFRSVIRSPLGVERTASVGTLAGWPWTTSPVTPDSAMFFLAGGSVGSGYGIVGRVDLMARSHDSFAVWINPTATVTTDYAGGSRIDWGWTAVGGCYGYPWCDGPAVFSMAASEVDGTAPAADPVTARFLAALTPAERAAILAHDVLLDPAGRDAASLATDPRLLLLGQASLAPGASTFPVPAWTPCAETLSDETFEPLSQTTVQFARSSEELLLQHGVLSSTAACRVEQPGLSLGTNTPSCRIEASVFMDRRFGTLVFAPTSVSASCIML